MKTLQLLIAYVCMFFLICLPLCAQGNSGSGLCRITGRVVDEQTGTPAPYVTVRVRGAKNMGKVLDSSTSRADGSFVVSVPRGEGEYVVTFTSVEKRTTSRTVTLHGEGDISVGDMSLTDGTLTLGEVQVTADRPLVRVSAGRLSYDVAADPNARDAKMIEIMGKVPMVTVNPDNSMTVFGAHRFQILQNGRRTMVTRNPRTVLESLPANLIKRVDVITTPAARYQAEGIDCIIDIITAAPRFQGHLTSLSAGVQSPGVVLGVNTLTQIGKFSLEGTASYSYYANPRSEESQRRESAPGTDGCLETTGGEKTNSTVGSVDLHASYEIDTLRLLTLSLSGKCNWLNAHPWLSTSMSGGTQARQGYQYSEAGTRRNSSRPASIRLDYQRLSRRNKQRTHTLSYLYSVSPSWRKSSTLYDEITDHTGGDIASELHLYDTRQEGHGSQTEHTVQYDFSTPLAPRHTLEVGAKYIARDREIQTEVMVAADQTGEYNHDEGRGDHYKNHSDILSAYLSYTYRVKSFSLMPFLRYEYTSQDVKYLTGPARGAADYSSHYANLVPSVKLDFSLPRRQSLALAYAMRLSRPGIGYLNPFFNDLRPQYITQGNSRLGAERSHTFTASYGKFTRRHNVKLTLSHAFLNDGIERVSRMVGEEGEHFDGGAHFATPGAIYTTYVNAGHSSHTTLDVFWRWMISRKVIWTTSATGGWVSLRGASREMRGKGWTGNVSGNLMLTLPWSLMANARIYVRSTDVSLQGRSSGMWGHDLNIMRPFMKRKLMVTLMASDPFRRWVRRKTTVYGENFTDTRQETYSRQVFMVTARYTFGNLRGRRKSVRRSIYNGDLKEL